MRKMKCFALMPLFDAYQEIFDVAIVPAVRNSLGVEWECSKADDKRRPGMVTEKIVHSLLNADLLIAVAPDTRETANFINPNVMYELGIAHSFRKPTIVVSDRAELMPFDLRAVEAIEIEFSRFKDPKERPRFLLDLKEALLRSLGDSEVVEAIGSGRIPRNPITTQLSDTRIFIEDLPWLWGYCRVLERECEAKTVWEISRDLFWGTESLFFESIKAAICAGRKHYFMVPEDEGILGKVDTILNELRLQRDIPVQEIDNLLRFVAIDKKHFQLWPISIVIYDADMATSRGGIICEPMTSEVGNDLWDMKIRRRFEEHKRSGGRLEKFQEDLASLDWVERRLEATFDIALDGRVVDRLATSFAQIWNEKIWEDAKKVSSEQQSTLLQTWLIPRR